MASTVGSLAQIGLGNSSGLFKQETIDKLKSFDESAQITPLEERLLTNSDKQIALSNVMTYLKSFKSGVAALSDEERYDQYTVNIEGSGSATVTALESGVGLKDFSIQVNSLASKDSYQSKGFADETQLVNPDLADGETFEFKIHIGDASFKLEIDNTTTLKDLSREINAKTNGKIDASILNTGGDEPYRLIIQSAETGKNNEISFSADNLDDSSSASLKGLFENLGFSFAKTEDGDIDIVDGKVRIGESSDVDDDGNPLNVGSRIQAASDAKFKYNGVNITRSSNEISDLIKDVTIKLTKTDEAGSSSNLSIVHDTAAIGSIMETLSTSYNNLVAMVESVTDYDADTKTAGALQGVNEINTMRSQIRKALTAVNEDGKSILDFGVSFTDEGLMTIDYEKLSSSLNNNFDEFKNFFSTVNKYDNISVNADKGVSAGVINGNITINGFDININTSADATAEDNAKTIVKAINDMGFTELKASYRTGRDEDGNVAYFLQLEGIGGGSIELTGDKIGDENYMLNTLGFTNATDNVIKESGSVKTQTGFFEKLNNLLDGYTNSSGVLSQYGANLSSEATSLEERKERIQESLDKKYSIMQIQFAKYESILNSLNSQFELMKNTFEALINSNKK